MGMEGVPVCQRCFSLPGGLLVFTQVFSMVGVHIYLMKIDSRKMYSLTPDYSIFGDAGYT